MADLHDYKHARHLSSSLTTPKPTFMVEFAVVAMLYCMPQAKSGEIVGYRYPTIIATKLRWLCILFVYNECESPYAMVLVPLCLWYLPTKSVGTSSDS